MRHLLALAGLLCMLNVATGQDAAGRRYGIAYDPVGYSQATPADAVQSASKAAERGASDYLLAHLVAPATVDQRVVARSALVREGVDRQLRARRDAERNRPDLLDRLPFDPTAFAAVVGQQTALEAFRGLSAGAKTLLLANPRTGRELRRAAREGTLAIVGERATYTIRDDPRQVSLVKVGNRWYVDDSQSPSTAPPPAP